MLNESLVSVLLLQGYHVGGFDLATGNIAILGSADAAVLAALMQTMLRK